MDLKSILLVIGIEDTEADLDKAVALCVEQDAHLSVLVAAIALPASVGDYPVGEAWLDRREMEIDAIDAKVAHAKARCAAAGLSFDVEGIYPERAWSDAAMAERARYADLSLIGSSALRDPDLKQSVISGMLIDEGRAIMLMPDEGLLTLRPKTVLLAFDRSVAAGRAGRAALEVLAAAEAVHLVIVDPVAPRRKAREQPGFEMARYLARHDVHVVVDELASCGRTIEEVLIRHATDVGAGLLVMGAYGHSRLRERMFGGVTRSMLDMRPIPVLMAH